MAPPSTPPTPQTTQRNLVRKVAIVTGAASGFGAAVSRMLAKRGAIVVMGDVDEEKGGKMVEELQAFGGELDIDFYKFKKTDCSDLASIKRLFDFAQDRYGGVDIVVNNAGIGDGDKYFHQQDKEDSTDWVKMVNVNVNGVIYGTQLAVRRWQALGKRGGVVVNTASAGALREVPDAEIYAATKAAVLHFSRSLGHLHKKNGIRVVAICPSAVPTPLWHSLKNIPAIGADAKGWEALKKRADKLTPEDIAEAMMIAVDDEGLSGVGIFVHGKGKMDAVKVVPELGRHLRDEKDKNKDKARM